MAPGPKRQAHVLRRRVEYLTERIDEAPVAEDVQWDRRERAALLDAIEMIEGSIVPRSGGAFVVRRESPQSGRCVLVRDGSRVAQVEVRQVGDRLVVRTQGDVAFAEEEVAAAGD